MVRTHITIPDSTNCIVKSYCESNNLKYSQSVTKLIELEVNNIEVNKAININNILMDKINHKLNYTIQGVMDFGFTRCSRLVKTPLLLVNFAL